jgi:type VI secretion system secreted protein VgrG
MAAEPYVVDIHVTVESLDAAGFRAAGFEVTERLSGGLRGLLRLESLYHVEVGPLLGKKVSVRLGAEDEAGPDRYFHCVILAADLEHWRHAFGLTLEIGSRVELARLTCNCRLFHDKSVPKVVAEVLGESNIKIGPDGLIKDTTYPPHETLRQWNESDFDFAARLLAREGIAFTIRNDKHGEHVELLDGAAKPLPIEGAPTLTDRAATISGHDTADDLHESEVAMVDSVMMRDYDFEHPGAKLDVTHSAPKTAGREVYIHPAGYTDADGVGKRMAEWTLDRLRARGWCVEGVSDCPRLEVGRTVTLDAFPRAALQGDYTIISVEHRVTHEDGAGLIYENQFQAVPLAVPARVVASSRPVRHAGVEVAFVTGVEGQELHGSKHGEAKVHFPWDRRRLGNDRSSGWCRVAQLALGGSMTMPRVGFEVVMDYELGELDRPFVVGHLYNKALPPPYELPANATRTSIQTNTVDRGAGANELRFEDAAGGEEILINASYDYECSVEHDATITVVADEDTKVKGNNAFKVDGDADEDITQNRKLEVTAQQKVAIGGDLNDGTGSTSSLDVGALRRITVQGDLTEMTKGTLARKVGGLESVTAINGYQRKVSGNSQTTVGGAWLEAAAASRSSQVGGNRTETVGALKMVKAKSVNMQCGDAYVMNAAAEVVRCGADRVDKGGSAVGIQAGGGISVKAANVNISAQDKVVLNAGPSTLEITTSEVTLKSSSVKLDGVKALSSTTSHETD